MHDDYLRINLSNWNSRVPHHEIGYELEAHHDPAHLSQVVRFDIPRLGSVAGLDAVHLQCHIGTDTVSLAKLGARMTGLDFSEPALDVDHVGELASPDIISFNHSLSEIFNALWSTGMQITGFVEHDSVPWNVAGEAMECDERGEYRMREQPERLAATYTLQATKG